MICMSLEILEQLKRERTVLDKIMVCKICHTKWHVKNPKSIYWKTNSKSLSTCPNCTDKYPEHSLKRRQDILRNAWGLRRVRSDTKSLDHKRKVTRERVKRWRDGKKCVPDSGRR